MVIPHAFSENNSWRQNQCWGCFPGRSLWPNDKLSRVETEPVGFSPFLRHLGQVMMPRHRPRSHALSQNMVKLLVSRIQQADGGRGRCGAAQQIFSSSRKSKYQPRPLVSLARASTRSLTTAKAETGRQRQRFLRRGEANVQSPGVGGNPVAGDAAYCIYKQQRIGGTLPPWRGNLSGLPRRCWFRCVPR